MRDLYAKVVVKGSPISKSNFKLFNSNGRAILPYNSGKYHDRYALYEEEIALQARSQNAGVVITQGVIAILKVFYKSEKRHPDTNNITKSIFDGIEKSGLIINDAQIKHMIIEEFYDKTNPRFELELFGESDYSMEYSIKKRVSPLEPIDYSPPPNRKKSIESNLKTKKIVTTQRTSNKISCHICGKSITKESAISANKGSMLICKTCFKKLF